MSSKCFSTLEMDAIGEILNISLGASATAVSTMLNARVDITTPVVNVVEKEEFRMDRVEPAVGVEITYISGLQGKNIMLLKRHDVKVIVEMLMGIQMSDEEFELNEMNISAVCEVMNQMMGASSTALSEFLGKMVNISTPISFPIESEHEFVEKYFQDNNPKVVVGFTLKIADKLESEFFNVMPIELAKSLVDGFIPNEEIAKVEEEKQENPIAQEVTAEMKEPDESKVKETISDSVIPEQTMESVATQMPQMSGDASMMQMQMMQQMMMQMQMMQQKMEDHQKASEPRLINVQTASSPAIAPDKNIDLAEGQAENMELIMGVPLELSVEIGRTKKLVKDILDFTKGSLVVLDKLAGEQVDLFVNGQCIAKGDVVVVEDNFGIRITEIMKLNLSTLE
ncbi:MAG: flagellar motor switch phosphatase FliY [Faecalimonas sp.]|nr:flagellar motor switch phosphatase FliY [Faecalimonas sp.]